MATDDKKSRWLWLLLLLLLLLWWWWSRKPAAAAGVPVVPPAPGPSHATAPTGPSPPPQAVVDTFTPPEEVTGSSMTAYATFNPDHYAPETRAALNTVSWGLYDADGRLIDKVGLYRAYELAKAGGLDTSGIVAQMERSILVLFPNTALMR